MSSSMVKRVVEERNAVRACWDPCDQRRKGQRCCLSGLLPHHHHHYTMVLAPPTPPPTSTTEIQDAARGQSSTAQAPQESQPTSSTPDSYQLQFPTIVDVVARSDYEAVIQIAEAVDLNVQ